jgi:hypothetical protein
MQGEFRGADLHERVLWIPCFQAQFFSDVQNRGVFCNNELRRFATWLPLHYMSYPTNSYREE